MKILQIAQHGDPAEVIKLVEAPDPGSPGPNQAIIDVLYAPINPFDLHFVRGRVPGPGLPAGLGSEGIARVVAVGPGVSNIKAGDLVFVPNGLRRSWSERLCVPNDTLFALPVTADPVQLAMAAINPPTAGALLSNFVDLKPGDWIVQNAGNSAMAINITAFAKARDLRVISIVRRDEAVAAAEASGADVVAVEGREAEIVAKAVGDTPIRLGLDGVGSRSTMSVSRLIAFGGTLVAYSAMSGEPGLLNPGDIIFRDIHFRGLFIGHPDIQKSGIIARELRQGIKLIDSGKLVVPVGGVYPLEAYRDAIAATGRGSKILLRFNQD